jgi:ribosomal-protein-alanine N-acetyltransferase
VEGDAGALNFSPWKLTDVHQLHRLGILKAEAKVVSIRLVPINPRQNDAGPFSTSDINDAPNIEMVQDIVRGVEEAQQQLYARTGALEPWIGYFALDSITGELLGSCSFVGSPTDGSVEIAYFTFPPSEGRGVAAAMASELVAIARASGSTSSVHALTLPAENPSTRVLRRLGFNRVGTGHDAEAGEVWRWELAL